jgi:hypothetical protein
LSWVVIGSLRASSEASRREVTGASRPAGRDSQEFETAARATNAAFA